MRAHIERCGQARDVPDVVASLRALARGQTGVAPPRFEPKLLSFAPISGWSAYATTRTAVVDLVRVRGQAP